MTTPPKGEAVNTQPATATTAQVVVYTKPACMACTATKRKLDQLGVPYVEASLVDDEEALLSFRSLGILAAPVVTDATSGAVIATGYNPDKLAGLVDLGQEVAG